MGARAELLAIGPCRDGIKELLDYPGEYKGEGYQVITTILGCVTSQQSRDLAELLDTELRDFKGHFIPGPDMLRKLDALQRAAMDEDCQFLSPDELNHIILLAMSGFNFIYRPEY